MTAPTKKGRPRARSSGRRASPRADHDRLEEQYDNVFPRLLNAVTSMATTPGNVATRLASVVHDVTVFHEDSMPPSMRPLYREFRALVYSAEVPRAHVQFPEPVKSSPAYWLHPRRAARAAELLAQMFEGVAYGHGLSASELVDHEDAVTADAAALLEQAARLRPKRASKKSKVK